MDSILSHFSFIVEPNSPPPPFATEPLAIRLHPEGGIEGIARAGKDSTLSLYADDLLLYVSHPTPHGSSHGSYYHMWGLFRL